jgi:SAM-dependent methyltransferase
MARVEREFDELIAEAASVSVDGWEFSWLDGRATERRPSWGYQRLLSGRLAAAQSALDIQTGGGEVLAGASEFPRTMAATESWPPNLIRASRLLMPRGVVVVSDPDEPPLPFADESFDLVTSRHPTTVWWTEIARVLTAGGTYFAQHVGPDTLSEFAEHFIGPQSGSNRRRPDLESADARAAGLEIVDVRCERLEMRFFDIGAVVYFLRKVIWAVPGFTVDRNYQRLRDLHEQIQAAGHFLAHSSRTLIEVRKPDSSAVPRRGS